MSLAFSENDTNTNIPTHPQSNCDCMVKSLQIVNSIPTISNPPPPSLRPPHGNAHTQHQQRQQRVVRMPLNEILAFGRRLVQHWQTLNDCPAATSHKQGTSMLRSLAESATRILRLYELAVEHLHGGRNCDDNSSTEETLAAQQHNSHNNNLSSERSNLSSSLNSSRTTPLFNDPIRVVYVRSPTYMGRTRLDGKDEDIVAFEALRQSTARLGDLLRDVEADVRRVESEIDVAIANAIGSGSRCTFEESTTQLFRLLAKFGNCDI